MHDSLKTLSLAEFPADPRTDSGEGRLAWARDAVRHAKLLVERHVLVARYVATGREPIFIFSHPRTGSTSIWNAIAGSPRFGTLHLHTVSRAHSRWRPEEWPVGEDGILRFSEASAAVVRSSLALRHPRFVVPIRDPVAVNISFFLYWASRFWMPSEWRRLDEFDDREIARRFADRFPHYSVLRWMDGEFALATGLDVGSLDFDTSRAAAVVTNDRASALILRSDLPDAAKHLELCDFLGQPIPPVRRDNSTDSRLAHRPGLPERIRRIVVGIPGYVDTMLDHDFTRKFWSDAQRREMRERWLSTATVRETTVIKAAKTD
jgi:hypothetical protein